MKTAFRTSLLVLAITLLANVPAAFAVTRGPGWETTSDVWPTHLSPGGTGMVFVTVLNIGAAASNGTITVTDVLPAGLTATDAGASVAQANEPGHEPELWDCTGTSVVRCTNDPVNMPSLPGGGGVPHGSTGTRLEPRIAIAVKASPEASGTLLNRATVAGGGAPTTASTTAPITVSETPAAFGVSSFDVWFSNADGTVDTQAGSHPYAATFTLDFNTVGKVHDEEGHGVFQGGIKPAGEARNIEIELPPGLIGDPSAVPQCPRELFDNDQLGLCPADTQIGIVNFATGGGILEPDEPVFNIVPPPGKPAEFAFVVAGNPTFLDAGPRTGGDYGITTNIDNVPQRRVDNSTVTLWGNPGDPSHGIWRAKECQTKECVAQLSSSGPLLTLPTACAGPQRFTVRMDAWFQETITTETSLVSHDSNDSPAGYNGCEHLGFAPTITATPDTTRADTPAGLTVEVTPPVGGLSAPNGLSSADIQNTTVTLPEGLVINPGQAAGLQACQSFQDAVGTEEAPSCPAASKVGVVTIKSPLIEGAREKQFEGSVYVLQSNPPEVKLLVAASADGVNLKLVGIVHLDERTGRLTTKFEGTPQLPFTVFKLSFSGGAQAALGTPVLCGAYATNADFNPWSSPFISDFLTNASFDLSEGPDGGACSSSPLPFSPSLVAGSTTDQAGSFTDFSLRLQRGDGQQRIEKLSFNAPQGLSGMISQVPLCQEPQAAHGSCGAASHIGHAVVTSGPGPYPLVIPQPGEPESSIYLTGPYEGAPFGLSIVTHVIAGPFDLGTIVTRARIEVDPHTAQITVTTDPLPQIVAGVPTDLRLVNSVIDRPGFMFNPTNCNQSSFSGTAWGTPPPGAAGPGATAPIASHFGVGSCQSLKFAPKFTVSSPGKTSRANGAGLTARLSYPNAPQGSQANITRVKVDLPKQLPSRLTTLQKACTSAQFEANPAGCPAASKIGMATVTTPVLPVPLTGPAIFVSHGGEAFPSLTMVLQGYGVTVDLVGATFISRAGITSTTFKTVPDVPFNTFTLTLPQGKYSALAANGNLCASKLALPTEFLAQNGLKINASTPISVTGCAKKKSLSRAQRLTAALRACHKKAKGSGKRAGCERQARKKYGPAKRKKRKK